jgi:hypothetical protein
VDLEELVDRVASWEGVLALRPGPGDGSPETSWGDVFFYVAPDGQVPRSQPFATVVTKDYPGEPDAGLDRPGSFRVNVSGDRGGAPGTPYTVADPSARDQLMPHPVYGPLGWVAVVDPGERTREPLLALLHAAHAAALARWRRRHAGDQDG